MTTSCHILYCTTHISYVSVVISQYFIFIEYVEGTVGKGVDCVIILFELDEGEILIRALSKLNHGLSEVEDSDAEEYIFDCLDIDLLDTLDPESASSYDLERIVLDDYVDKSEIGVEVNTIPKENVTIDGQIAVIGNNKYYVKHISRKPKDLFIKEVKILSSLDHPNIIKIWALLTDNDKVIGMMTPLANMGTLDENIPSPMSKVWFSQISEALDYVRKMGINYTDIKPSNVIIHDNNAILIDFDGGTTKDWDEDQLRKYKILIYNPRTYACNEIWQMQLDPKIWSFLEFDYGQRIPRNADKIIPYLDLASRSKEGQESMVDDFAKELLRSLGFDSEGRLIRTRHILRMVISGQDSTAQTDVCIIDMSNTLLLLVQEDKRDENPKDPEPQVIAEAIAAFQENKVTVTRELSECVMTAQYPSSKTIVLKHVPNVRRKSDGMKPVDSRRKILQCYEAFKKFVDELQKELEIYDEE
ncbi:kinase-like protein [Ramaria rubella]|nr:kinase-like protein [Ramaria rubella]